MLFYWSKLLYRYYSLLLFFPLSSFCLQVGDAHLLSVRRGPVHGSEADVVLLNDARVQRVEVHQQDKLVVET